MKQETVRLLFSYHNGILYWKPRPREAFRSYAAFVMWNKRYANTAAGAINHRGYIRIGIAKKYYMAHRLIWLYHRGWLPEALDHKNGRPWDNRMSNLRPATQTQNRWNSRRRISTTTNTKGVYRRPSGHYEAHICADYKRIHLGTFKAKKDAIRAVAQARKDLHREFARHR